MYIHMRMMYICMSAYNKEVSVSAQNRGRSGYTKLRTFSMRADVGNLDSSQSLAKVAHSCVIHP